MISINPILSRVLFLRVKMNAPVEAVCAQALVYILTMLVIILYLFGPVSAEIYDSFFKLLYGGMALLVTYLLFVPFKFL